jgi:hypothetical protein
MEHRAVDVGAAAAVRADAGRAIAEREQNLQAGVRLAAGRPEQGVHLLVLEDDASARRSNPELR